jgi:ABC-2 type transport system ATP-binding protein
MGAVIETRDLTKHYGAAVGLEGLDLRIEPGEVLGFLGPNGAGKTTCIRLLLDLIRPTRGSARLFGRPVSEASARERVGYLPGDLALDERLTGRGMLALLDALRPAGSAPCDVRRQGELCERLRLTDADLARLVRDDSRGTRQKIGLIAALQRDPELLVLDEPTTGLDPLVRDELLALLGEAGARGRTVFYSSHVLSDVDRTCTRVAILRAGRLVALQAMDALRGSLTRTMIVRFRDAVPAAELDVPGAQLVGQTDGVAQIRVTGGLDPLLAVLARHPVLHMAFPEPDLEDAFRHYYSGEDAP